MAYYDAAILYVGRDKEIATALVRRLQKNGLSLWWNQDLTASEQLSMEQMADIFRSSRRVIALLSENAAESEWMRRELELAHFLDKEIIPCLIGNEFMDSTYLMADLPFIDAVNCVDLRSRAEVLNTYAVQDLARHLTLSIGTEVDWKSAYTLPWLWSTLTVAAITSILYLTFHSSGPLAGRLSPKDFTFSGLTLFFIGALMSGARQMLELAAAWKIMKKLRTLKPRERGY